MGHDPKIIGNVEFTGDSLFRRSMPRWTFSVHKGNATELLKQFKEEPSGEAEYNSFLLSEHVQCHRSIADVHSRIDQLSRNYLFALIAFLSFYFSSNYDGSPQLLLVAPILAAVSFIQTWLTWKVAQKLVHTQIKIENTVFNDRPTLDGKFLPAKNVAQYYGLNGRSDPRFFDPILHERRLIFWVGILLALSCLAFSEICSAT